MTTDAAPDDAAAPSPDDDAVADAYRVLQARRLLDELGASLPEGDPLRQAIERGRAAEGLPPLPPPVTP